MSELAVGQKDSVTVPAAASAMGVSRIVVDRAIKAEALKAVSYNSGGKNPGFRLIPVPAFKKWLIDREGYHTSSKSGGTQFHAWDGKTNPDTIAEKALEITNTPTVKRSAPAKKAKKKAKAA